MSAQILVVSHFAAAREMLAQILRFDDYDVSVVNNGEDVVALCEQYSPDLLVLPVENPELDTVALVKKLRGSVPFLSYSELQ